jgi:hypothetical protein
MRQIKGFYKIIGFLFLASILSTELASNLQAQELISSEGIVGDVDEGRRAPIISFSTKVAEDKSSATILVDTQVINEEYKKFPIVVDFFVNGRLFSRQYRSPELPAPLGIDVPKELAEIPFNYSVVATLLHTNRQYVSVIQGAINSDQTSSSLTCEVDRLSDSLNVSGDISNILSTENEIKSSFGTTPLVELDLQIEPNASSTTVTVSGDITIADSSGTETSYEVSGDATAAGSLVSDINLSSDDGEVTLTCETKAEVETDSSTSAEVEALSSLSSSSSDLDSTSSSSGELNVEVQAGPQGEDNFIPLDKIGDLEVVN